MNYSIITVSKTNSPDEFNRTANSLCQITDKFEWIFVDGGNSLKVSTMIDNTRNITYLIREIDSGFVDAWNKGIACASGDFIMLLNCGDEYSADFIKCLDETSLDSNFIYYANPFILSQSGCFLRRFNSRPNMLRFYMSVPHEWCIVPYHLYNNFGCYSQLYLASDYEYFLRLFMHHGVSLFKPLALRLSAGNFYEGGLSDNKYFILLGESFRLSFRFNRWNPALYLIYFKCILFRFLSRLKFR